MIYPVLINENGVNTNFEQADKFIFDELFEQYYQPLVFFARRLVQEEPVAEDIITDVFLKLWQRLPGFTSAQSIKAFLYISTRNACLNHLQQAKYQARVRNSLRYLLDDNDDYVCYELTRAEVLRQVFQFVNDLPPQCRKIILLCYSSGLNNHQIAAKLQISVHTVRNQKVRGIELVRRRMQAAGKGQLANVY